MGRARSGINRVKSDSCSISSSSLFDTMHQNCVFFSFEQRISALFIKEGHGPSFNFRMRPEARFSFRIEDKRRDDMALLARSRNRLREFDATSLFLLFSLEQVSIIELQT